ncbi:MAG: glycosyltransferase [bacterium]|nr:glycosyltransferase [bacterium]
MITLTKVVLEKKDIKDYEKFLSPEKSAGLKSLAKKLAGKKVVHINATAQGGGVAEILQSLVPFQRGLGIDADWFSISAPGRFFEITKKIHNGLQGKKSRWSADELNFYFFVNKKLAGVLRRLKFDLAVIHDPQPMALIEFCHPAPMISRIHIDLSTPDLRLLSFFLPYLGQYEKIIFSLKEFIPREIPEDKTAIIRPAIDPLISKNKVLPRAKARKILMELGVNPQKPIIAQISRFDPWKDPMGVIDAYYAAKNLIPDLQLILLGLNIAKDDPECVRVFQRVKKHAKGDPDIYLFYDPSKIPFSNSTMVNAVQSGSDIILQKSIREGFGLTVTEAMWRGKPVIGGDAAGIKCQIDDQKNGFIVKAGGEAAEIIIDLLKHPEKARKIGLRARRTVKNKFLITRLAKDHLELYREVLGLK